MIKALQNQNALIIESMTVEIVIVKRSEGDRIYEVNFPFFNHFSSSFRVKLCRVVSSK